MEDISDKGTGKKTGDWGQIESKSDIKLQSCRKESKLELSKKEEKEENGTTRKCAERRFGGVSPVAKVAASKSQLQFQF